MKWFSLHRIVVIIFICGCCVDPFNTSLSGNKILVVDGLLTNQSGPHTVTLSYSTNLGTGLKLASGANVSIVDNVGNEIYLGEKSTGMYQTDSLFKAQDDKTYFLRIHLDNQTYESEIEKLLPVGELDSIYFKAHSTPLQNEFQIYANSKKPLEGNALMKWRSSYTFEIVTWPQFAPEPPPCADPCICCICWVSGHNDEIIIGNASNFTNDKFNDHLVATIPIDDQRFQEKYYLQVDQLSLSTNAYNFWSLVISQETGGGSLFQPASARIRGNVHSMTNPNEQVLGLFQVSTVVSKSIFIKRSDVPFNIQKDPPFLNTTDCRIHGTNIRPSFW